MKHQFVRPSLDVGDKLGFDQQFHLHNKPKKKG